jgi:hypothetical protein
LIEAAGQRLVSRIPEIEDAVSQLSRKTPLHLANRQEQILILSHYVDGQNIQLEVSNEKGNKVPMSSSGLYEMLKTRQVVDDKTLGELFKHPKILQDVMSSARVLRRAVKNRERRAAKKAGLPAAHEKTESTYLAPTPPAPSLVSMLYHR